MSEPTRLKAVFCGIVLGGGVLVASNAFDLSDTLATAFDRSGGDIAEWTRSFFYSSYLAPMILAGVGILTGFVFRSPRAFPLTYLTTSASAAFVGNLIFKTPTLA